MADVAFHRPDRQFPERDAGTEVVILAPPAVEGPMPVVAAAAQYGLALIALLALGSTTVVHSADPRVMEATLIGAAAAGVLALAMRSEGTGKRKGLSADRRRYYTYLKQQEVTLRRAASAQRNVDERLYPTTQAIATLVQERRFLWERRVGDPDFMSVCAGRGRRPTNSPAVLDTTTAPDEGFDPTLLRAARTLADHFAILPEAAVTLPMRACGSVALTGGPDRVRPVARSIVAQSAVFHAPLDLHVIGFLTPDAQGEWEWLKWLPHVRPADDRGRLCTLTDDTNDFAALIATEMAPRDEARRKAQAARAAGIPAAAQSSELPHLLVIIDGFSMDAPIARLPALVAAARNGVEYGITVLMVGPPRSEPPDSDIVIEAGRQMATIRYGGSARSVDVRPEAMDLETAETIARAMTPLRLDEERPREELATSVRLLELLGVRDAAAIDPAAGWRPRPRAGLLRTPVGVGAKDATVILDLKEGTAGGMGPHGLIAGAPGSGKSELLRDIITGLATSHSPDSLSIACVDVEGAGIFEEFHSLPHLAGMIGGLLTDDHAVDLMRAALLGEQKRRRLLLNHAGTPNQVREYQKRREQNPSMEPLPSLLVVVDDAGRLLAARPDIVEMFVALAAGDENVGIHLLLCGRSFDLAGMRTLDSLLCYRICLHLDTAEESIAVLGTPDGYHLPDIPGAAYLKVHGSGHLERFRVARISSPYEEAATGGGSAAGEIRLFTAIPRRQSAGRGAPATAVLEPAYTEMDVIVERLANSRSGPAQRDLFTPPPVPVVTLGAVFALAAEREHATLGAPRPFGRLRIPVGLLIGDGAAQPDRPLFLDLSGGVIVLAAAAGMGRTTFLRTVLGALMLTEAPGDLRIAGIDPDGGGLGPFAAAPHLMALGGSRNGPATLDVVNGIRLVIGEREARTRVAGAPSPPAPPPGVASAQIVLAIDDLSAVGADALDELVDLARRAPAAGVTIVATIGSWLELPPGLRAAVTQHMELRLRVPDHSAIDVAAAETVPSLPGQGLIPPGIRMQIAVPRLEPNGPTTDHGFPVDDLIARATTAWTDGGTPS